MLVSLGSTASGFVACSPGATASERCKNFCDDIFTETVQDGICHCQFSQFDNTKKCDLTIEFAPAGVPAGTASSTATLAEIELTPAATPASPIRTVDPSVVHEATLPDGSCPFALTLSSQCTQRCGSPNIGFMSSSTNGRARVSCECIPSNSALDCTYFEPANPAGSGSDGSGCTSSSFSGEEADENKVADKASYGIALGVATAAIIIAKVAGMCTGGEEKAEDGEGGMCERVIRAVDPAPGGGFFGRIVAYLGIVDDDGQTLSPSAYFKAGHSLVGPFTAPNSKIYLLSALLLPFSRKRLCGTSIAVRRSACRPAAPSARLPNQCPSQPPTRSRPARVVSG
jgi:hypothetical protein